MPSALGVFHIGGVSMNNIAWAFVVASLLIVGAGLIAWRAWHAHQSPVQWMRPRGGQIAHAIPMAELRAELAELEALAHCGLWPVAELMGDDGAERCVACVRAVDRMGHGHR